jgi:hypothetical protein
MPVAVMVVNAFVAVTVFTQSHLERSNRVWCNQSNAVLRSGVTVARLTLDQLVKVQILAPQLVFLVCAAWVQQGR